jgi:phosphonate transport system ATP-binding protein
MLKIEGIGKDFGLVKAVDSVTLEIPQGQMVGIIGCSGAGKSTLLRLINRLIDPSQGRIIYEEQDVTALKGKELKGWRASCAMIFQQFHLVNRLDVLTNVLIGRINSQGFLSSMLKLFSAKERAQALQALDQLDLAPQAMQRAETLSGGQQQRVAIARALIQDPEMVLADEPIASLDPHNAAKVMDALRLINREYGKTVIANLHTLDTARAYSDRVIGMARGKVVFDGNPDELSDDKVREIYGVDGQRELNQNVTSVTLPGLLSPDDQLVPQPA